MHESDLIINSNTGSMNDSFGYPSCYITHPITRAGVKFDIMKQYSYKKEIRDFKSDGFSYWVTYSEKENT